MNRVPHYLATGALLALMAMTIVTETHLHAQASRAAVEKKLSELRQEVQDDQQRLAQLDQEAAQLRARLLRVKGAIEVLEDELKTMH